MAKHHQSFFIRCWQLDRGEQRIDIEHIQSGEKRLARSSSEAIEWICARMRASQDAAPLAADPPEGRSGATTDER